jgi:hypothetical protein
MTSGIEAPPKRPPISFVICKTKKNTALPQAVFQIRIKSANASETVFTEQAISQLKRKLIHRSVMLRA